MRKCEKFHLVKLIYLGYTYTKSLDDRQPLNHTILRVWLQDYISQNHLPASKDELFKGFVYLCLTEEHKHVTSYFSAGLALVSPSAFSDKTLQASATLVLNTALWKSY